MQAGNLLIRCLLCCVYSEPGSDSSGSVWSCGISPPFPTQFKAVPDLHFRHLDRCDGFFLPISLRRQTCRISRRVGVWFALEWSLWRVFIHFIFHRGIHVSVQFYPAGVDSHTLHYHLCKAQVAQDSRREFGQRWTATPAKGTKCAKDGNCYCVRVCSLLNAQRYVSVNPPLWIGNHDKVRVWLPLLLLCRPFFASGKLCHNSLYLL